MTVVAEKSTTTALANLQSDRSWWRDPGRRALSFHCSLLLLGTFVIGYDGSTMNGFFAIPVFLNDVGHPNANIQGLMIAAIFIGNTLMAIPTQIFSDRFGRLWPQRVGNVFIILGTLIQVFKVGGWVPFFVSRLLIGFGTVSMTCVGAVHLFELAHPKHASVWASYFGGGYFVGGIVAAWLTFGCTYISSNWSWRVPSLVQLVPSVFMLVFLTWVPESPRFLIANGRNEEGIAILVKYHANGDANDALVRAEVAEIEHSLQIEAAGRSSSYSDFLKTPANRQRLLILIFIGALQNFAGNGIISYYLPSVLANAGITASAQQQGLNGGLQIFSFAVAIVSIYFSNRIGRRRQWLISFGGMFASYALLTICSALYAEKGLEAAGSASVAWIFTFNGFYVSALTVLSYSYCIEIMPYNLRQKGASIHQFSCTAAGVVNQWMNPPAFAALKWKYYIIYLVILALSFILVYYVFPETANLSLEESSHVLDNDSILEELKAVAGDVKGSSHSSEKVVEA